MRRLFTICSLVFLALLDAPAAEAQDIAARFEITAVGDTTFRFRPGSHEWVASGQRGIAVDPRRRDVMVARFQVVAVRGGVATAVITGQTTNITTDYVALIAPPVPSWYRRPIFWIGTGLGAIIGVVAGSAL